MSTKQSGAMQESDRSRPVFFIDLGGVLVTLDHDSWYRSLEAMADTAPGSFRDASAQFMQRESRLFESGFIQEADFFFILCKKLSIDPARIPDVKTAWKKILSPRPMMRAFLRELVKSTELDPVLLSNTNPVHFEYCLTMIPEIKGFRRLVLSHEIGAMKPDPMIYRIAMKPYAPGTPFFFMDDTPENVEAANRAGLPSMVFEGLEDLVRKTADKPIFGPVIMKAFEDSI